MSNFEKIVIIGLGRLAVNCAVYIKENFDTDITVIDANETSSKYILKSCEAENIRYYHYTKEQAMNFLTDINEKTLLMSACNPWIISGKVISKENMTAINLHHAYLPYHPGRNAEAWAIYEQDKFAGITWHMLIENVDKGAIIDQRKIELTDTITSIKLLELQNEAAFDSFKSFAEKLINGEVKLYEQEKVSDVKFHFSKEKPNNGELDLSWNIDKISAFLRCYDYLVESPFGKPFVIYNGVKYNWRKYIISKNEGTCEKTISMNDNELTVSQGYKTIKLTKIKEAE